LAIAGTRLPFCPESRPKWLKTNHIFFLRYFGQLKVVFNKRSSHLNAAESHAARFRNVRAKAQFRCITGVFTKAPADHLDRSL
jgi:hypothetical protein